MLVPRHAQASQAALVGLLKDLFDLSEQNQVFLVSRLLADVKPEVPKQFLRRVVEPFYPARGGFGKLNLADARRAIREYEKATGDLSGTVDLMLTYVESGTQFTREFGDIDARFYTSLESVMAEAIERLRSEGGSDLYLEFEVRLKDLARAAAPIGWGFGDFVSGEVYALAEDLAPKAAPETPPQEAPGVAPDAGSGAGG